MAGPHRNDPARGASPSPPPGLSYNPKSWFASGPGGAPSAAPKAKRKRPRRRFPLWLLSLPVGALVAGALFLPLHRPAVAPPRTAPKPAAAAPVLAAQSRRILPYQGGADFAAVLRDAGATDADAAAATQAAAPYLPRTGGNRLELSFAAGNGAPSRLLSAVVARPDGSGVSVRLSNGRYRTALLTGHVQTVLRVIRGEMDGDSFYTSAVAAGIDDRLVPQITAALSFDFDFQREIHKGDVFEIAVADTINGRGETVGRENLVFVRLVTEARSSALYRFQGAPGEGEWFDGNGTSVRRALMRTPVEGARISSNFGMRMHPILGFMRMHKGIDFATPVGTPVYASGDGTVSVEGNRSGYGLYLRIEHGPTLATAYAHLSRFSGDVQPGARVRQGQVVAFTGDTGELSTGPHLHYEVLVNGVQVDPLTLAVEDGKSLAPDELPVFRIERDRIDALRAKSS